MSPALPVFYFCRISEVAHYYGKAEIYPVKILICPCKSMCCLKTHEKAVTWEKIPAEFSLYSACVHFLHEK